MNEPKLRDAVGVPLNVGDIVACRGPFRSSLAPCEVVRLTPKMAFVRELVPGTTTPATGRNGKEIEHLRHPSDLARIDVKAYLGLAS